MMELLIVVLVVLVILLALACCWLLARMGSYKLEMQRRLDARAVEMERQFNERILEMQQQVDAHKVRWEKEIREDAAKRSQSVTIGKVTEHLVPYLPDFAYNPKDARFLGSPIDFIVFEGLSEGEVRSVVFVEVKTGEGSSLSARERQVRNAVQDKRVSWELLRANPPG